MPEYPTFPAATEAFQLVVSAEAIVDVRDKANQLQVTNQASYDVGIVIAERATALHKQIDTHRKDKGEPFRRVWATVNAHFKPYLETLDAATKESKAKCETWWLAEQNRREAAEQAQRDAEREAADASPGGVVIRPRHVDQPMARTTTTAGGARGTMAKKWKAKLVDLPKVPRSFLMVDWDAVENELARQAKVLGGKPSGIKGFELYEDASLRIGRKPTL